MRPHALTRKYPLFAGHDEGPEAWARIASLIGTCRMNGCALARQRRQPRTTTRLDPPQRGAEGGVAAQVVVVAEVLVAQRDAKHALPDQRRHLVREAPWHPAVGEAAREAVEQANGPVRGPKQQRARIRGDRAAAESRHYRASIDPCKAHRLRTTLYRHRGLPVGRRKCVVALTLYRSAAPMRQSVVKIPR